MIFVFIFFIIAFCLLSSVTFIILGWLAERKNKELAEKYLNGPTQGGSYQGMILRGPAPTGTAGTFENYPGATGSAYGR